MRWGWNGWRMSQREYRANLDGLNIFFGAVIGFVLAGTETLPPWSFALLLTGTAGVIVGILYITSSEHPLVYAALTGLLIAFLPKWLGDSMPAGQHLPSNVQPTLAVWAALTFGVEIMPRRRDSAD
jgi:hypothetical protein